MQYQQIQFVVSEGLATLTLNRPEARNAMTVQMRAEFEHVLAHLKAEAGRSVRVLIITGTAGHFCAGGDMKAQHARVQGGGTIVEERARMRASHNRLIDLANLEMPVIAAVDGAAAGAGFGLALAADFILASDRAFFVQSFGRLGLVPDWNTFYLLPRLVGLQKAKELIFTARRLPAPEAQAMGIVHSIYAPHELMPAAERMARRLMRASTTAIALAKNILNQSFHQDNRTILEQEAMAQAMARETDFHREALRRFVAREPSLFDWDRAEPPADDSAPAPEVR
ncbi:MAG: hypothetical protein ABT00_09635 [Bordetella sp. SCN 68-11]|nr:MAG: hypothetical protein ABT00_09635 [Bordetella sp. SCN 68-11]